MRHLLTGHMQTDLRITVCRVDREQHLTITPAQPKRVEPDRPGDIGKLHSWRVLKEPDQVGKIRNLHSGHGIV